MAILIPTTQQIIDTNIAILESALGETAPIQDKAFLKVLAAMQALGMTQLFKFGVEGIKQVFAITAIGINLDLIGQEYGVIRKAAEAAVLTITLPATNGTIIPQTVDYVGTLNNVRYKPTAQVTAIGGLATSNVTAQTLGTIGNLNISDTMTIGTQIAGAETIASVTVVVNVGAELETDDAYRERILNVIRPTTGGGNGNDHIIWSLEVAGVTNAYPYTGKPDSPLPGVISSSIPGDRTVFIEVDESLEPDGVPSTAIKDEVRASINTDPVTGFSRPPLGLTDSTLFVEGITRTPIFIKITNIDFGTGVQATIEAEIDTALTTYLRNIKMFIPTVDLPQEQNDKITKLTLGDVVQDVLTANNASAELITFGLVTAVPSPLDSYTLDAGELVKLGTPGGIVYVP